MTDRIDCEQPECRGSFPVSQDECPHCGTQTFPNVNAARLPKELASLKFRYDRVKDDAEARSALSRLKRFEEIVEAAEPVTACSFELIQRLAGSDSLVHETFYMRGVSNLEKGSHVTSGTRWDFIRTTAETAFFGDHAKRRIHFAALSPDGRGLTNYGECSVTLRRELIQNRTSVLIKNMLVFFKEMCGDFWKTERIPAGFRAVWKDRARLAVTKCGPLIDSSTDDDELRSFLLTRGASTADDDFIELHIYGNITVRTMRKIVLTRPLRGIRKPLLQALLFKLQKFNVQWEDQTTTP